MFSFLKSSWEAVHVTAEAGVQCERGTQPSCIFHYHFMEAKNASLASVSLALWVVDAEEHASLYIT